jgi:hypothetical protein
MVGLVRMVGLVDPISLWTYNRSEMFFNWSICEKSKVYMTSPLLTEAIFNNLQESQHLQEFLALACASLLHNMFLYYSLCLQMQNWTKITFYP